MKRKRLFLALGVILMMSSTIAFISCNKSDDNKSSDNQIMAGTWKLVGDDGYQQEFAILNSNGHGYKYVVYDGEIDGGYYFTFSYNASKHTLTASYQIGHRTYTDEYYISWKSEDYALVSYFDDYYETYITMEAIRVSSNQNINISGYDYYDYYGYDYDYYDYYGYDYNDWYYDNWY